MIVIIVRHSILLLSAQYLVHIPGLFIDRIKFNDHVINFSSNDDRIQYTHCDKIKCSTERADITKVPSSNLFTLHYS